jgi:lipopolysaccharide export system protein LptA
MRFCRSASKREQMRHSPPAGSLQRVHRGRRNECALRGLVGLALVMGLSNRCLIPPARAQPVFEAEGFQAAGHYDPPNETQVKWLLKGARARPLTNDLTLLTQAELETFRTNGLSELRVRAPQCIYDRGAQTAHSAGPMEAESADGKFSIAGEGFFWRQTRSSLEISNRVHSVVHPELLTSAQANSGPDHPATNSALDIFAEHFHYSSLSGKATYSGNARVVGSNLDLAGGRLTLELPQSGAQTPGGLKSILIETNVLLDYTNYIGTNATFLQTTGQRADYATATGLITIRGQPAWRADQRHGRGDELVIDRTNKVFRAIGHAWMEMPGQALGSLLSVTNTASAKPGSAAQQQVEIWSDNYEFRTNWGVFRQGVRVQQTQAGQPGGTMTCEDLTVFISTSNTLDKLVASTQVVIEQETNRFTGAQGVFTPANGVLELTGRPTWRSGLSQGKGGLIQVNTQRDELLVRTNAWLHLPAEELGASAPGPGGAHPSRAQESLSAKSTVANPSRFADVYCEEYLLRRDSAVFRGGVYVSHTNMNWVCETLDVQSIPGGKVLIAQKGVVFDLAGADGQKTHGTGDKAVYTNSVVGTVTNKLLTLTGRPAMLLMTNGLVEDSVLILDQEHGTLTAPDAGYRIKGTAKPMDTNIFNLPQRTRRR